MARLLTPPVTVVQGDDAPDIVVTLQQDSTGTPYLLTDKAAFAVIVDKADPTGYIHKFEVAIEDAEAGKVRISWLKDQVELTSYLDDLEPGKRYEIQIYLGSTNLPPSYVTLDAFEGRGDVFGGRFEFIGEYQEGAPVFKNPNSDQFLSRSSYSGNGQPDEFVWLITSLRAATWAEVAEQDKASLTPDDLGLIPLWNYRQVLLATEAEDYILHPKLEAFDAVGFVITEGLKYQVLYDYEVFSAGDAPTVGTFRRLYESVDIYSQTTPQREDEALNRTLTHGDYLGDAIWVVNSSEGWLYSALREVEDVVPPADAVWTDRGGGAPVITGAPGGLFQFCDAVSIADPPTDIENRGTQTVLTQIPIIVKPAYRLGNAD